MSDDGLPDPVIEDIPPEDGEPGWWCWRCHGLGSWEESMEENDDGPCEVECPCCRGDGHHGEGPCR